jgi:hypothetical protein
MKTTLVLGAGASKPFGYPLGPELKDVFKQKLSDYEFRQSLNAIGYEHDLMSDLADCLNYGRCATIDELLDAKKRFRQIGGIIIAKSLIEHEKIQGIFPAKDWLGAILDKLLPKILRSEELNLSIVTLNYDRTVEFFFDRIAKVDGREEDEERTRSALKSIPIIHPHGCLGSLEDFEYGNPRQATNTDLTRRAGENIMIISDKLEDSKPYADAQSCLAQSERIICLGFAYHPSTMKYLFNDVSPSKIELVGTCFKLNEERMDYLKAWPNNTMRLVGVKSDQLINELIF